MAIYCTGDFKLVFTNKNNEILLIIEGMQEDGYFNEYSIVETPDQYTLSSIGERKPNEHFPFRDSLILNVHFDSIQDSIVLQYYIRYGEISE